MFLYINPQPKSETASRDQTSLIPIAICIYIHQGAMSARGETEKEMLWILFLINKLCFYMPIYPILYIPGRCEVWRLMRETWTSWCIPQAAESMVCSLKNCIHWPSPRWPSLPWGTPDVVSGSAFLPDSYKNVERTRNQLWLLCCSLIEITQKDKHESEPTSIILMEVTTCMRGLDPFHINLQAYTKHHWGECTMRVV